jgi:hypothetical protein
MTAFISQYFYFVCCRRVTLSSENEQLRKKTACIAVAPAPSMFGSDILAPRHRFRLVWERFQRCAVDLRASHVQLGPQSAPRQDSEKTLPGAARKRCREQRSGDRSPHHQETRFRVSSDSIERSALREVSMRLCGAGTNCVHVS